MAGAGDAGQVDVVAQLVHLQAVGAVGDELDVAVVDADAHRDGGVLAVVQGQDEVVGVVDAQGDLGHVARGLELGPGQLVHLAGEVLADLLGADHVHHVGAVDGLEQEARGVGVDQGVVDGVDEVRADHLVGLRVLGDHADLGAHVVAADEQERRRAGLGAHDGAGVGVDVLVEARLHGPLGPAALVVLAPDAEVDVLVHGGDGETVAPVLALVAAHQLGLVERGLGLGQGHALGGVDHRDDLPLVVAGLAVLAQLERVVAVGHDGHGVQALVLDEVGHVVELALDGQELDAALVGVGVELERAELRLDGGDEGERDDDPVHWEFSSVRRRSWLMPLDVSAHQ